VLSITAVWLAGRHPALGSHWFARIEGLLSRLAQRKRLAVFAVGILTLGLRLAVLPAEPIPHPAVHDEFSYLLQADTFAHERLTNPTPKMWEHFETFHEIFKPTYCSKYFPAQGLFLALGQVVFGHPYWGVWLTSGLMCAAVTWMLQGWFSPGWALVGGLIATMRFGVFGYWADSYWGGNVAAIGGALVLGALPRIKSGPGVWDSILMGVGLVLLANSRPWEGLVLSIPVAMILIATMMGPNSARFPILFRRILLPLSGILALCGAWLGYYNRLTTGDPLRTSYQVYEQTYGAIPYMIWQHVPTEPQYQHAMFRKLNSDFVNIQYQSFFSLNNHLARIASAVIFFLGPVLLLPFAGLLANSPYGLGWRVLSSDARTLLTILVVSWVAAELAVFYSPHYSAPMTGLIVALVLLAMRRLKRHSPSGAFLSRTIPIICMIVMVLHAFAAPLHISTSEFHTYGLNQFAMSNSRARNLRALTEAELSKIPGDHLAIVRYGPEHDVHSEWVYNGADIDHARIIWARDMGKDKNSQLIGYFKNRRVWLVEPDAAPQRLMLYGTQGEIAGAERGDPDKQQ
jgi:hypothetical protein